MSNGAGHDQSAYFPVVANSNQTLVLVDGVTVGSPGVKSADVYPTVANQAH